MVEAQLAGPSLPAPEIHGLNPDISKNFMNIINCMVEQAKIQGAQAKVGINGFLS